MQESFEESHILSMFAPDASCVAAECPERGLLPYGTDYPRRFAPIFHILPDKCKPAAMIFP